MCTQQLGFRCAHGPTAGPRGPRATSRQNPERFPSAPARSALLFLPQSLRSLLRQHRLPPTAFTLSPSARGSCWPAGPPPSLLPPLWPSLPKVRCVHRRISRESWEAALGRSLWLRTSSYLKIAGEKEGATHAATMPTPSCTLFSDRVAPGHPVLNPYAATPGPYSQTEL